MADTLWFVSEIRIMAVASLTPPAELNATVEVTPSVNWKIAVALLTVDWLKPALLSDHGLDAEPAELVGVLTNAGTLLFRIVSL